MQKSKCWIVFSHGRAALICNSRTEAEAEVKRLTAFGYSASFIGRKSRLKAEEFHAWFSYDNPVSY